jgi:asparagine synthase (glutamine-hydrolysing)
MCGISGCLSISHSLLNPKQVVDSIISNSEHRGPDGSGFYNANNDSLALGHTRLSIFDLTDFGQQPMHYRDRFTITFNGAIYNFLELQQELISKGHIFKSTSDTEVILAAFSEWGTDCVHRFNGMWAFAIWDDLQKSLFLSRDRFGVKPLYYHFSKGNSFTFASEIQAFKSSFFDLSLNKEHVLALLHEPNCLDPLGFTPYENLYLLPAGHSLVIDKKLNSSRPFKWWNLTENQIEDSDESIESEFNHLMEEACEIRLRSDAPLASALSGGLDSSSIFTKVNQTETNVSRFCPGNYRSCFNMAFNKSMDSEHKFAKLVATHFQQNCKFALVNSANLWSDLSSLTSHFGDFSGTPLTCISPLYNHMSNNGIKVSIDGHGGDECLLGYPDMINDAIQFATPDEKISLKATLEGMLKNPAYSPEHHIPISAKARIALGKVKRLCGFGTKTRTSSPINQIPSYTLCRDDFKVPDLVNDYRERKREMKKSLFGIHRAAIELERLPLILRNFDKASMFSGVEIRAPFLDYRLVEFCCNLPLRQKVRNGYTKYILRKTIDEYLPSEITWRKHKIGINAPLDLWMEDRSFASSYREQLEGNTSWISEILEIPKPAGSLFDATKDDLSLNWFLLNLSFLRN